MKVLFCGLGGIGQRHLRNLLKLSVKDLEIYAFRKRGLKMTLTDTLTVEEGVNLEEKYNIKVLCSLDEALTLQPDIVFVTNPSAMHFETISAVIENTKADLFIEKPLGHTPDGFNELIAKANEKGVVTFVGFQNRFHPCIKRAKELLEAETIGKITSASLEVGEYLPGFHKYEDYRETYPAKKALGGGVVLTQIHEIDYACHFFGKPYSVYAQGGKLSDLEIETEDTASILLSFENAGRKFPVHIHMDFIQNPASRHCKITGAYGRIEFDLINASLVCYDELGGIKEERKFTDFVRNDMFLEELNLFLSVREGKSKPFLTMEEGLLSLEAALAAKQSMETNLPVLIRSIQN